MKSVYVNVLIFLANSKFCLSYVQVNTQIRVGPDIRFCRIPDIKTIWILDIWLISNTGYSVFRPDIW